MSAQKARYIQASAPSFASLCNAVSRDVEARQAFEKITRGSNSVAAGALRQALWQEMLEAVHDDLASNPELKEGIADWKDKWDGLRGTAKSLRLVGRKMKRHTIGLTKVSVDPLFQLRVALDEYGQGIRDGRLSKECRDGLEFLGRAQQPLAEIEEMVEHCAKAIEGYCKIQVDWWNRLAPLGKMRSEGNAERLLLSWCGPGKPASYEKMASLLNVGRRLTGRKPITGDALRHRHDPPTRRAPRRKRRKPEKPVK